MISRILTTCLTCKKPITVRAQVGHENEQAHTFSCPHCGTDIRIKLLLNNPPHVKVIWEENCEQGKEEGIVVNLGVGFTIPQDALHSDMYFPAFTQLPKPVIPSGMPARKAGDPPVILDLAVALGAFPGAADSWATLKKALRFHGNNQSALRDEQISKLFEGWGQTDHSIENAVYMFLARLMGGKPEKVVRPLVDQIKDAAKQNKGEVIRLVEHYDHDLKKERFENYVEIIGEYFRAFEEFNQTLIYARMDIPMPPDSIATSSAFDSTKMFYGNAFEVLGTHLDLVAAINNICSGRAFDQMQAMDLKQYRGINKANRTKCFAGNAALMWLVDEYDSQVRNASHHRWFKIDDTKRILTYRSGGTGALQKMTYAEYLYRCNRVFMRLCAMACMEIIFLYMFNKTL